MKSTLHLIVFWLVAVVSPQLHAQVYVGVVAGISDARSSEDELPEFESDIGFRGYIGNQLSEKFAIEVAYVDLGAYEVNTLDGEVDPLEIEDTLSIYGYDISIVGKIPLRSYISVYARLGVFGWEGERYILRNIEGQIGQEEGIFISDGVDGNLGLGIEYQFMDHLGLTLDVNQYKTDDIYHSLYGLGLYFTF